MLAIKIQDWKNQPHLITFQEGDNVLVKVTQHNKNPKAGVATITVVGQHSGKETPFVIYVNWSLRDEIIDSIENFLMNSEEMGLEIDGVLPESMNKTRY